MDQTQKTIENFKIRFPAAYKIYMDGDNQLEMLRWIIDNLDKIALNTEKNKNIKK